MSVGAQRGQLVSGLPVVCPRQQPGTGRSERESCRERERGWGAVLERNIYKPRNHTIQTTRLAHSQVIGIVYGAESEA